MKRRLIAVMISTALLTGLIAGCGKNNIVPESGNGSSVEQGDNTDDQGTGQETGGDDKSADNSSAAGSENDQKDQATAESATAPIATIINHYISCESEGKEVSYGTYPEIVLSDEYKEKYPNLVKGIAECNKDWEGWTRYSTNEYGLYRLESEIPYDNPFEYEIGAQIQRADDALFIPEKDLDAETMVESKILDKEIVEVEEPESSAVSTVTASNKTWKAYTEDGRGPDEEEGRYSNETQFIRWAKMYDGVLYVSIIINGYSKAEPYSNYMVAIQPEDGYVLWRSDPLVCNSDNFQIIKDSIVCGYGFTDEPDYIYLLDRFTGQTMDKIKVNTAADQFEVVDDTLFVATYNTAYEFQIESE